MSHIHMWFHNLSSIGKNSLLGVEAGCSFCVKQVIPDHMTKNSGKRIPRVVLNRVDNCSNDIVQQETNKLSKKSSSPSNSSASLAENVSSMAEALPSNEPMAVQNEPVGASQSDVTFINLGITSEVVEIVDGSDPSNILRSDGNNQNMIMVLLNISATNMSTPSQSSTSSQNEAQMPEAAVEAIDSKENVINSMDSTSAHVAESIEPSVSLYELNSWNSSIVLTQLLF